MSTSVLHTAHSIVDIQSTGTALRMVRCDRTLPAAEAVAAFARHTGAAPTGHAIGYATSPVAATWLRLHPDGTVDSPTSRRPAPDPRDILSDAYELVLFDGERELRWLRTPDGAGATVAIGEQPDTLPPWTNVTPARPLRRGPVQLRLLAGTATTGPAPGWTTLHGGRYATAHLPCRYTGGDVLAVESVEYLVEDDHGNVDVADSRLVALRLHHRTDLTAPDEPERTTP